MARLLNLVIVIFEIIAFLKSFKWHGIKKNFVYKEDRRSVSIFYNKEYGRKNHYNLDGYPHDSDQCYFACDRIPHVPSRWAHPKN